MINIALPKGRLGKDAYKLFAKLGYDCSELLEDNRKMIFEGPDGKVRYLMVKPTDVAIYVERGVADIGVVGKDTLMEQEPDVYELMDLGFGACRMVVAAMRDWDEDMNLPLKVATKYPAVAQKYFSKNNRQIDVIKLNGNIELAPMLGLSDVIVDIVQTGTTLKENDLTVRKEIAPSSARLIANKSSYNFCGPEIDNLVEGLSRSKELIANE